MALSKIDLKHFQQLTADRKDSLRLLNKTSMRGIRESIIEKYSEKAHFVYELLQNADDVNATYVRFKLREEGLYFIHNGTVPFTVTAPNQTPTGHINAITSIGDSSKKEATYKIGKFGVGFKSVFQYTTTPHIYDPNVSFCIRDLIVPELLEEQQHPMKDKAEETLFFFPFNHPDKTSIIARKEIQIRLQALKFPLLFLNHLQEIKWETELTAGFYKKEISKKISKETILVQEVKCLKQVGKKLETQQFLQLTEVEETSKLKYSLVFLKNENHQFIPAANFAAHCFFPTRVPTNLQFLTHAPFLLTDSREGIKLDETWNKELIQKLAGLLTQSFTVVKDLGFLKTDFYQLLPLESTLFKGETGQFFFPFYQQLYTFLTQPEQAIFPIDNGHTALENAFLAESQSLRQLLTIDQLRHLTKQETANWIFPDLTGQTTLGQFIRQLLMDTLIQKEVSPILNWETALRLMELDFFEKQSEDWLIYFYTELLQNHRSLWSGSKALAKQKAIVRLENGKMVTPFHLQNGTPNAYIPTKLKTDYPTVKNSITENELAKSFLENLGLSTPILRDELENYILPKFINAQKTKEDILPSLVELEKIITHYWQCNAEEAKALETQLSTLPILQAVSNEDGSIIPACPNQVYFENELLHEFFQGAEEILWLPVESLYEDLLTALGKKKVIGFFEKMGVAKLPRFIPMDETLEESEKKELMQQKTPGASYPMWEETVDFGIDGLIDFLNKAYFDYPQSILLWKVLTQLLDQQKDVPLKAIYRYEWQDTHEVETEALWLRLLKSHDWILNQVGDLTSAVNLKKEQLYPDYNATLDHPLVELLFAQSTEKRLEVLTPEERKAIELGRQLLEKGLKLEDFAKFQQWQVQKEEKVEEKLKRKPKKKTPKPITPKDADEFNPAFLSSEELIEKQEQLRQKLEGELQDQIDELMKVEQLKSIIKEAPMYSFAWFKALLELEYLLAFDQTDKDKSISIFFEKVEKEKNTAKTITLRKPVRYIPLTIENMGDIQLKLQLEDERRTIAVEVVSIKDFSLRAKLKTPEEIEGIDFKKIRGAVLEVQNTIFTLEELLKAFHALPFEDEHNLKELLPKNIRFIFGPPGTGKTTYLAREEIMPAMLGEKRLKILVLTPTNKSADVLVRKILDFLPETPFWLYRFGTSGDSVVENAGLLRDGTFDISDKPHFCAVTTATRFPYDGFNSGRWEYELKNIEWDIILVDEASMISLAMITFIIHQQPKAEIIIAGDPFQIEPIVFAEEWKGQNIYTMVNLQSFNPELQKEQLEPYPFPVHNLITQYRSIATLGYIYSHLAYDGKLRHHRLPKDRRPLKIEKLPLKEVNIIRFPVIKLETLLRPQRLNSSHYHIYSALLTAEIVQYLAEQIYEHNIKENPDKKGWNIGVICPYKAQAMLVDKVIAAQHIFRPKLKISCGTIHSFQGDECDIIINLLNPPLNISKSPNMFLNRQNILNVAVSRARDYLILLVPDEHTPNRENLYQINRLEKIINYYLAGVTQKWASDDIEEKLFGQIAYIEQNTFATTHQSINVYTQPEKQYEIRCEDTAIDVQINKQKKR
ncbi:MAG: DEAD/DEAH box helicase [Saprospiraceae bacterium]